MAHQKIGLWPLVALVTGNLVGSGVFLLPSTLAPYGTISLFSWIVATVGAVALSLVFGQLNNKFPRTGGPHVYVEEAFGKTVGFFTAWGYWFLAWIGYVGIVVATVGYLTSLTGDLGRPLTLFVEVITIMIFTLINLRGIAVAGKVELFTTVLKLLPLVIIPIIGLFFVNLSHFEVLNPTDKPFLTSLNSAVLVTIWCYMGLETGTVPSGDVHNTKKTVPRALVIGTLIAAFVYILGSIVIMGVVPPAQLIQSTAPYADVASILFGGNWHKFIACAAVVCCVGALNGWVLVAGSICYGAAKDGLFPKIFIRTTKEGAPKWGLVISALCAVPFVVMSLQENLVHQFNTIVDISVTLVMMIYVACMLAYIKFLYQSTGVKAKHWILAFGSVGFSVWVLSASSLKMVILSFVVLITGIPVYWWQKRKGFTN